jgi:hypothetical protein
MPFRHSKSYWTSKHNIYLQMKNGGPVNVQGDSTAEPCCCVVMGTSFFGLRICTWWTWVRDLVMVDLDICVHVTWCTWRTWCTWWTWCTWLWSTKRHTCSTRSAAWQVLEGDMFPKKLPGLCLFGWASVYESEAVKFSVSCGQLSIKNVIISKGLTCLVVCLSPSLWFFWDHAGSKWPKPVKVVTRSKDWWQPSSRSKLKQSPDDILADQSCFFPLVYGFFG